MIQNAGTQILAASGAIGVASKPVRLFSIHVVCGTAANAFIHSGGSGGTACLKEIGTANTGKTINYGDQGMYFPSGAYCSFETNVTRVVAVYAQDSQA
jgi:hypothetical protein